MSTGLIFAVVILEKAICVRKLGITAKKKKKKKKNVYAKSFLNRICMKTEYFNIPAFY